MADTVRPESCQVLEVQAVEVRVLESYPPQYAIEVTGVKPCLNMRVELMPLTYIQQPEYWGIEVVGCVPGGFCLPALGPYEASILNPPRGTKGIVIIGANGQWQIDIPPDGPPIVAQQSVGAGSASG